MLINRRNITKAVDVDEDSSHGQRVSHITHTEIDKGHLLEGWLPGLRAMSILDDLRATPIIVPCMPAPRSSVLPVPLFSSHCTACASINQSVADERASTADDESMGLRKGDYV